MGRAIVGDRVIFTVRHFFLQKKKGRTATLSAPRASDVRNSSIQRNSVSVHESYVIMYISHDQMIVSEDLPPILQSGSSRYMGTVHCVECTSYCVFILLARAWGHCHKHRRDRRRYIGIQAQTNMKMNTKSKLKRIEKIRKKDESTSGKCIPVSEHVLQSLDRSVFTLQGLYSIPLP